MGDNKALERVTCQQNCGDQYYTSTRLSRGKCEVQLARKGQLSEYDLVNVGITIFGRQTRVLAGGRGGDSGAVEKVDGVVETG